MINVIGDIIIDEYWHGKTTRLSPEAPVPIVELGSRDVSLGGAANVYTNIKSLTSKVTLFGLVQKEYFEHFSDKSNLIETIKMPVKIRVLSEGHYVTRIDDEEYMDNKELNNHLFTYEFKEKDIFFISDYNKGSIRKPQALIDYLNLKKQRIIVDPKVSLDNYKNVWILKPNRKEFEDYAGKSNCIKGIKHKAIKIRKDLNVENLIITLAGDGVLWISEEGSVHIPTKAKSVFDVTGAGDTFGAIMAYALDHDYYIDEALVMANQGAAKAISKQGTYVIQPRDIS